jgi:low temperature requirement protein LtrA
MNKSPAAGNPVLLRLLNRAAFLSLVFCLCTSILYAAGIRQEFTDHTQLLIVQCGVLGGMGLLILSLYRFFAGLWFCLRQGRPLLIASSLGFLVLGALGALLALGGSFIAAIAGGNT